MRFQKYFTIVLLILFLCPIVVFGGKNKLESFEIKKENGLSWQTIRLRGNTIFYFTINKSLFLKKNAEDAYLRVFIYNYTNQQKKAVFTIVNHLVGDLKIPNSKQNIVNAQLQISNSDLKNWFINIEVVTKKGKNISGTQEVYKENFQKLFDEAKQQGDRLQSSE